MKKRLTTFFMFAALLLAPFALVGCGEDIQVPDNPNNEAIENPIDDNATVFSSSVADLISDDGTRTSMSAKLKFFWEPGDVIWLDEAKDGQFSTKLTESKLSADKASANFYLRGKILNGDKYDILYTGNDTTTTSPFSVTIAKEQTQTKWNNAEHFGESGDCGVAEATPNGNGKYSFVVKHKAAYLMLAPYLNTAITESCELTKIEIVSANGDAIAGTYPFNATNGLVTTSTITNPSDTIRLHCTPKANSGDAFTITPTSSDTCFVVLQPGTHTLTIKYTIKSLTQNGRTFTFVMDAFTKNFKVNGVTTIRHELTPLLFSGNYIKFGGTSIYTKTSPYNSTIAAPTQLSTGSWANVPNANHLFWYAMRGDPRWDGETPWILTGGTAGVSLYGLLHKRGVWILKWQQIVSAHGASASHILGNVDLRVQNPRNAKYDNTSSSYTSGGKPTDTSNYFFLPAAGAFRANEGVNGNTATASGVFSDTGSGLYWSKSPNSQAVGTIDNPIYYAYCLTFGSAEIACNIGNRVHGGIITNTWWQ